MGTIQVDWMESKPHLFLIWSRLQQFNIISLYNNASVYMLIINLLYVAKTKWARDRKCGIL